jgi:hypothetical protein
MRGLRRAVRFAAGAVVAALALWAALAVFVDGPTSRPLAGLLAVAVLAGVGVLLARVRPFRRACVLALALWTGILCWWLSIPPRDDRDWQPDVSRAPTATVAGSRLTVRDVRDFDYRSETDFDARWETREYDLSRLCGVDLFVSHWGPTLYAHTILSWDFGDASPLAVSIETRKERSESYSAVRGFFRRYELAYVAADERDVVRLRASFRGERVWLYRLAARPETARALLLQYLDEMNRLAVDPAWYNAATLSCTTAIFRNLKVIAPAARFDWRFLANGFLPDLAYEQGMVDTSLPLEELRRRSDVTARAEACGDRADFAACIREGLPLPAGRR